MAKRGLPTSVKMRHDSHYIEELASSSKTVGKVIKIDQIEPNPDQPRREFGDLSELTSSIKQNGVLEPILVKPFENSKKFMIIAGERRWRASNLAGLEEVPCIELNIDDNTVAEIALIENLQRKDLTIWEISDGLADLADRFGYTHDDIAKKIGKSRTTVTESMAIAGLPDSIRQKCIESKIKAKSTLVEISRQFNEAEMLKYVDSLINESLKPKQEKKKQKAADKKSKSIQKHSKPQKQIEQVENSFDYKSKDGNFSLLIVFEQDDFDNKQVLHALKEVFDKLKNSM